VQNIEMDTQVDHMLALKVMRLTRPALMNFGNTIFSEKSDLLQFDSESNVNILPKNQLLQLPQAFGNIYLGETFSSYICVHNCTTHPVNAVSVKCDLQSNNSRVSIPIHANKSIPTSLGHGETLDDVIHYEVKEIGTHILVCEVNYVSPAGLPLSFRKFFKFQVLKPLDVTTKFYNSETDEVFLEATVSFVLIYFSYFNKLYYLKDTEHYRWNDLSRTSRIGSLRALHRHVIESNCRWKVDLLLNWTLAASKLLSVSLLYQTGPIHCV